MDRGSRGRDTYDKKGGLSLYVLPCKSCRETVAIMLLFSVISFTSLAVASALSTRAQGLDCGLLKHGGNYTINSTLVDAGSLVIDLAGVNNFTFCRVFGKMPYGPNNTLNFEVWLPEQSKYEGRYLSVGELARWIYLVSTMSNALVQEMAVLLARLTMPRCSLISMLASPWEAVTRVIRSLRTALTNQADTYLS